jgi:small-conductance mechanosensitive channel
MTPASDAGGPGLGLADGFLARLAGASSEWHDLVDAIGAAWGDASLLRDVTLLVILVMTVASCEILYWCYAMPAFRSLEAMDPPTPGRRLAVGLQRLLLKALGIGVGVGALVVALSLLSWPDAVVAIAVPAVAGVAIARGLIAVADLVLSPRRARLRLWPASDEDAWHHVRLVRRIVVVASIGGALGTMLADGAGALALREVVEDCSAILIAILLLRAVRSASRQGMAAGMRRRRSMRDLLPLAAVLAILAGLAFQLAAERAVLWTMTLVGLLILADHVAGVVLHEIVASPRAEGDATGRAAAYEQVLRRLLRLVLAVAAVLAILAVWRVDLLMEASADSMTARIVAQSANVAVVVLLCDLAWLWTKTYIARKLIEAPVEEGEAASRLSTLLPMIRTSVLIVLVGLVTLVALSAMGVNIAPLLAGAGVVGLAIGFGAQTLVRDVITGVFFLIEDAFRVGEYVDVGTRKGTVEAISLRSLRLRHQRGALHTVPFGEIKSLSNESRDWSIVKLEFRIPFDTDLAAVKKIIKTINAEIAADPELGPNLIEPLKSQGINRFEEYWMVLRVKFTAKPNSVQFTIRREAYQRIRDRFEKAGIKLGERSVKVEVAGQSGSAAAGAVADEDERVEKLARPAG